MRLWRLRSTNREDMELQYFLLVDNLTHILLEPAAVADCI